jgi:phage tail sheath gpL-like
MATLFNIRVNASDGANPVGTGPADARHQLRKLIRFLDRFNVVRTGTIAVEQSAVAASGTITMASSSGTVGAVVNGVTITVTWATSDTASSAALAAAINASANALVSGIVTATSAAGVTTITAAVPGAQGNAFTLAATGTNVTASGSRLAGGSGTVTTLSF